MNFSHTTRKAFQNPWTPELRCFYLERYNRDGYTEAEKNEESKKNRNSRIDGKNFYKGVDHTLSPASQKKKKNFLEGLDAFGKETGIDVSRLEEQAEDALTDGEVDKLGAKLDRIADHYYADLLSKSGAFTPVHAKEAKFIGAEMRYLKESFTEQPLFVKGKLSKIQILSTLQENLKPRISFRQKLRRLCENPMIRDEYLAYFDQQLAGDPKIFLESREDRLKKIMEEVKEVEDSEPSIQNEFRKLQRKRDGKDTATIKKEVNATFDKKLDDYIKKILPDNRFGGPFMVTPYGKMRAAKWEFITWFKELESFQKMDEMAGALDGVLVERKKVYDKRDDLLKSATPEDAKKIKARTDEMRFHNLKAYLPELEAKLGKTSAFALEYSALLEDAEAGGVPLFSEEEKIKMKIQMQVADLDLQKAKLVVLEKESIPQRTQTVYEYLSLEDRLRNDKEFIESSDDDREALLRDAKEQMHREEEDPLDLSDLEAFGEEERADLTKRMRTERGKDVFREKIKEFDQQGKFAIGKVQGELFKKIYGVSKHMEETGNSMKDEYLEDRARWMRISKETYRKRVEDVTENDREKWQVEALEEASTAYDMNEVSSCGGVQEELNVISNEELGLGLESTQKKIKKSRYPQFLLLTDETGKDELRPHQKIMKKNIPEVARVLNMFMEAMGMEMKLNVANKGAYVNSPNIKKEMAKVIVEEQFAQYLNVAGANNTDHFIDDVANAA